MPELPEVEALVRFLDLKTSGLQLDRLELASWSALKTVHPPLADLVGRKVQHWQRRGKYLCLQTESAWLIIHLARGGWLNWYDDLIPLPARPTPGPLALRVGFAAPSRDGAAPGLDLTEAGSEKRLSLWVAEDPVRIAAIAGLGADPLDPAFDAEALGRLLETATGTVKSALCDQSLLAGVGNAYSDEVLHGARLSPFQMARTLSDGEVVQLHAALRERLCQAVTARSGLAPDRLKIEKRRALRVHGRTGSPCPACSDRIREVSFATRSLQYCPTCQTGGRHLADRRLSRLLK
ncbi:MAG TPA: DNA-formamidopyrimidine glycosylase family protein [Candidatus Dormibacteraeota bacterium]|nr:DNA-formamidopyrimidine glycosylase family protein [Candidatus Dormibacteraeota bacterium]